MADDTVQTLHPTPGKTNKRIDKEKYHVMKEALLSQLHGKEMTHTELFTAVEKQLTGKFSGNISWYAETVKLDLEARKRIVRTTDAPQKYRMK